MTTANKASSNNYNFVDQQNIHIPNKVKCTVCGREVLQYHVKAAERIMMQYDGNYQKYLDSFKCQHCKAEASNALKAQFNADKIKQQIEKAKQLLIDNGYIITEKQAAKKVNALPGETVPALEVREDIVKC